MSRGTRVVQACAAVVMLIAAPAAPPAASASGLSLPLVGDLGPATQLENGLYEVTLRTGAPLTVHGADAPAGDGTQLTAEPRPPKCSNTPHDRVLYGRPALSLDGLATAAPRIQEALWRLNGALDEAALESGGRHADLRVRCDGDGFVRIDTFVNPLSASFADVVDAARLAGATDPDADYVIFYGDDVPEACGVGSFSEDDRASAENANDAGGGYAVVYSDCWDGVTALHEIAHTQGAVQPGSPYGTGQGHCRDGVDVMCYADGAEGAAGLLTLCDQQRFDCGYDDYFDAAPEAGEYLAGHWNLGSPLNRFIEFSDATVEDLDAGDGGCALTPSWMTPEVCDDGGETVQPPMRIRSLARVRGNRVRLVLGCPAARSEDCRGRVELRARARGSLVARRRHVGIGAGSHASIDLRLLRSTRRAYDAGRLRRLRVTVDEPATAIRARRTVNLRGARSRLAV